MKYLKAYEEKLIHYLFPIENELLQEVYEYLYMLGCNPIVYEIPKKWKTDMKNIKNKDYLLYYNIENKTIIDYIFNRSYVVKTSEFKNLEIAEEKDMEMKLYINQ